LTTSDRRYNGQNLSFATHPFRSMTLSPGSPTSPRPDKSLNGIHKSVWKKAWSKRSPILGPCCRAIVYRTGERGRARRAADVQDRSALRSLTVPSNPIPQDLFSWQRLQLGLCAGWGGFGPPGRTAGMSGICQPVYALAGEALPSRPTHGSHRCRDGRRAGARVAGTDQWGGICG
jgi:hypothetical protein